MTATDATDATDAMAGVPAGLRRLRAAAESGELGEFCRRHGIRVLTVFGSAARGETDAHDLDVGIVLDATTQPDPVGLLGDLVELAGTEAVDPAFLNRGGPVIRERALVGSVGLYESEPGALTRAAMAATLERMDTRWMRDLDLELMAAGR
ncbi:MAG: nucleotidyltransferase family protein [Kineosporiaceae bacterium]